MSRHNETMPINRRILIVDDNRAIHEDFKKILLDSGVSAGKVVKGMEDVLFGADASLPLRKPFLVDSAFQGQQGLECVEKAIADDNPYAMVFLDVRMPPGWDGIETAEQIWKVDPDLLIVICTAYSDYSWESMITRLGETDKLVILKKPFDAVEVLQLAHALTEKWRLGRAAVVKMDQLEAIVGERTAALQKEIQWRRETEIKLEAARDAAESANLAKSHFLANMSHEIRTPMNGIIGMCQLLMDAEDLPPDLRDLVLTLTASGEVLLALINDILDFSKIEADKLVLEQGPFSLEDLVGETVQLFASEVENKNLELICEVDLGPNDVFIGDATRLRQVLQNLLNNAIKFTEKGEILVRVTCTPASDDNQRKQVKILVRDTGIGVSKEDQRKLFKPFTQADASITRRFGGTGLGLAICQRLIKLMGGSIELLSQPGQGTSFIVEVQLKPASLVAIPEEKPPAVSTLAGRRVLVVDDNTTNRRFLGRLLQIWSLRVTEVAGAAEALASMSDAESVGDPFQMVLIDYHMPDKHGLDLAAEIMGRLKDKAPAMLLLTSHHQRPSKKELNACGIAATLFKPLRKQSLLSAILQAFGFPRLPALDTIFPNLNGEEKPDFSAINVLVAEDNLINQRVALLLLRKLGCRAEAVADGREAVSAIQRESYDLVFMDCQMPVVDGIEATRQIREHEKTTGSSRIPIVAMTAGAVRQYRNQCLAVGMDDFITKPVRQKNLLEVITRILAKSSKLN